ncbi:uncharacterized protein STEHIDRAFT_165171 [Stereum hirsutum FP-91666 SS1]|uniref:uncharacterized protein n=1 Tax=Stereum hirsutum (strain FP-91666) TaxID=721885 RepID=UPI000440EF5D|nr:uncharacterized protein STEHIDRAFT_165171 [Stereum hirsutum FP-91666 SS1]EIM90595.1 hypothetical protein STEHIDRAFT_165171 [Stereum hirsutum FP-91666 SS1]
MALDLDDPLIQIKITESVCGFVAICMTAVRLYIRRGRYWWDDAWTFFSLLCLLIQIVSVFMHVENPDSLPHTSLIAAYYLMASTFYVTIWTARLSILFSIIRIDPDPHVRRRLTFVAGLFFGAILFFLAQLLWVCEPQKGWKEERSPQCALNKEVAICQVVSDVLSDLLLITLPLRLIHGIKSSSLRRRLYIIFSTSIITTIVSLVHAAYIITDGGIKVVIAALVEDCMSLSVANVPVVATAILRWCGVGESSGDGAPRTPRTRRTPGTPRGGTDTEREVEDDDDEEGGPRFAFSTTFRFRSRWTIGTREGATTNGITTTRLGRALSGGMGMGTVLETRREGGMKSGGSEMEMGMEEGGKGSKGSKGWTGTTGTTGTTGSGSGSDVDGDGEGAEGEGEVPNSASRLMHPVPPSPQTPQTPQSGQSRPGGKVRMSGESTKVEMERPPGVPVPVPPSLPRTHTHSNPAPQIQPPQSHLDSSQPPPPPPPPQPPLPPPRQPPQPQLPPSRSRDRVGQPDRVGQESYDIQWTPETSFISSGGSGGSSSGGGSNGGEGRREGGGRRPYFISVGSAQRERGFEGEG